MDYAESRQRKAIANEETRMRNYDYNLNGVFASTGLSTGFKDLKRFLSLPKEADPDVYLVLRQAAAELADAHQPAVGSDLGETMGQPTPPLRVSERRAKLA